VQGEPGKSPALLEPGLATLPVERRSSSKQRRDGTEG
jgi:hypothetical protein